MWYSAGDWDEQKLDKVDFKVLSIFDLAWYTPTTEDNGSDDEADFTVWWLNLIMIRKIFWSSSDCSCVVIVFLLFHLLSEASLATNYF